MSNEELLKIIKSETDLPKIIAFYILKDDRTASLCSEPMDLTNDLDCFRKMDRIRNHPKFFAFHHEPEGRRFVKENEGTIVGEWFTKLYK